MQQGKNNIISEINRIHQILGISKKTSDVVLEAIGGGLLDELASAIVSYAAKKGLDKTSRNLVRQLQSGNKRIMDASGKVRTVPLTDDEMVSIFSRLRNSSDEGLRKIVAQYDNVIGRMIEEKSIPNLLEDPIFINKVKETINKGYTEDEAVDILVQIPNNSYGIYASEVIDVFVNGVRKIYREMTGKVPDDVVDDTGKVVDDTGKVVDDTGKVVDDSTSNNLDNPTTTEEFDTSVNRIDGETNQAREILDVSPNFIRYQAEHLRDGEILANEVMGLIESRANLPATRGDEILNLNRQIKNSMDRLRNWNKEYVQRLEAEVQNNLRFEDSPNYIRWKRINEVLKAIKLEYGNWGVQKLTSPWTAVWNFIWKSFQAGTKFEIQLAKNVDSLKYIWPGNWGKAAKKIGEAFSEGKSGANKLESEIQAFREEVDTDLLAKTSFFEEYFIPGSPRGIPTRRKNPPGDVPNADELYLPNAYGQIQRLAKRYPMLQSWASLILEKIWVVIKTQLHYTWILGSYDLLKFILTDEKNIQKKYGDCVDETAKALKNGTFKIVDDIPQGVPPCLLELMKSEQFLEEELGEFMTRADFFSRGEGREAFFGYYTPYLKEIGMMDLSRLFTGSLLGLVTKFFTEWLDKLYEAEKAGDTALFENELDAFGKSLQNDLKKLEEKENTLVNNLSKSDKDKVVEFIDSVQNASGGTDFVINTDDQ